MSNLDIERLLSSQDKVPLSVFMGWAESDDPRVLEMMFDAVADANDRIVPSVGEEEFFQLLLKAIAVSLTHRGPDEPLSPYILAGEVLAFLDHVLGKSSGNRWRSYSTRLESLFAGFADQTGVDERALVNAYLEHFLERPQLREVFARWSTSPILAKWHTEAMEWVDADSA